MFLKWISILAALCALPAWADALHSLDVFLKTTRSGKADFVQVVTAPPKPGSPDSQPSRAKTSSGQFLFARPGKFKFVYTQPFAQTMVADGQTLWLYDEDLNQVTAQKQAQVLGATPVALIANALDIKALHKEFDLRAQPDQAGLEWLQATPKAKDGQLQSLRMGLRRQGGTVQLVTLEILDSFGQRSVLNFANFETNPTLPAATFVFNPPEGADVIRP
jgi:outer membrane lipoprotein carrier protein